MPCQTPLYDALVLPFLDYCSEVWGCMGKTQSDRLQRLQNRAGRIITLSDYNTRSADILLDLGWDTLGQRWSEQLAISVYKSLNNLYPLGLKLMFKPTSEMHLHNVPGSSNNISIQRPHTAAAKRAFSYSGASAWNGLDNNVREVLNLNCFSSALSLSKK